VNNVRVDGAGHTVLSLDIKLRGFVVGDGTVIHDITLRGSINHVADHESLGGLVLWCVFKIKIITQLAHMCADHLLIIIQQNE